MCDNYYPKAQEVLQNKARHTAPSVELVLILVSEIYATEMKAKVNQKGRSSMQLVWRRRGVLLPLMGSSDGQRIVGMEKLNWSL